MKLFCNTCEEAICRDCTIVKHRDHKYTFVKDAFSKGKESLLKTLADTKEKADVLEKAVKGVLEMKRSVHSCADQTKQEVVECCNELTDCIAARKAYLVDRVEEFKKAKLKSLDIQQEQLETALASVQSSVQFTEKALENGSEVEILNMRKQISNRLQDLKLAKWQLEPCANESLSFSGNGHLKENISTFGYVKDVVTDVGMTTVTMENGPEGVMYSSLCGQPVKFSIIAKESNGTKRKEGGDIFKVSVNTAGPLKSRVKQIPVKDCGNGTYSFCYTLMETGIFELSVQLKGSHVRESPFQWCVENWKLQQFSYQDTVAGELILSDKKLTAKFNYIGYVDEDVDDGDYDDDGDYTDDDDGDYVDDDGDYVDDDDGDYVDDDDGDYFDNDYADDDDMEDGDEDGDYVDDNDYTDKWLEAKDPLEDVYDRRLYAVGLFDLKNSKHMWKIQIHSETFKGFSFGVINTHCKRGKLVNLGSKWVWSSKGKEYSYLPSGTQTVVRSSITDCRSGDIIELYLDLEGRKLRMHNPRTKQSDTWDGVKGEVSPVFHLANNGDKVSLKIPHQI